MNTPTHLLINWCCAEPLAGRLGVKRLPLSAVLWGSVAPDLALYVLVFSGMFWFGWVEGWPAGRVARHMFSELFFHDPIWISLHNVLHSPTVLIIALVINWWVCQRTPEEADQGTDLPHSDSATPASFWNSWWTWFWLSCLLHTLVDIPVHHDDGPLVFWPLNWSFRYLSPISYWDPKHFGGTVLVVEVLIVLGLLAYRIFVWRSRPRLT